MRIVSWNVNGLRACARKGFLRFLADSEADLVGLQEVRAFEHQLEPGVRAPDGWHATFAPAERAGYSGVALYSREPPDRVETALGEPRFDVEGRLVIARFGRLAVASVYFPKGSGRDRDNRRVPYKLDFYAALFDRLQALRRRGPVFVIGDYNTAREPIDLARPAANTRTSGFLREERAELTRWIDAGWVDTFRARHPGEAGYYTWWRQWGGARENNVGWRIDYVLASPSRGAAGQRRLHLAARYRIGSLPGRRRPVAVSPPLPPGSVSASVEDSMVTGGPMHTGLARRSPGWRVWIAILAIALVGATSAAATWHEEHATDQDCAVCQLRHQPAAQLSGSLHVGLTDVPEPLEQAPAAGWIASGHTRRLPARAPPA